VTCGQTDLLSVASNEVTHNRLVGGQSVVVAGIFVAQPVFPCFNVC